MGQQMSLNCRESDWKADMKNRDGVAASSANEVLSHRVLMFIGFVMCCGLLSVRAEVVAGVGNGSWSIVDYALSPNGKQLAEVVAVRMDRKSSMDVVIRDLSEPKLPAPSTSVTTAS